ncbi:MAG: dihydroorotase [Lachnospiraceae bacterium]|nr:dihydroorotase [Lachnospiraceae bacterium]
MLIIKNGRYINPETGEDSIYDILIVDGKIALVGNGISFANSISIDARGMVVAPGLVDAHAHFRDPGFTYKETIQSGAKAAAKGGYTTVVLMANTNPPVDNVETLRYVLNEGKKTNINIASCATVTYGMHGSEVVDMAALAKAGAVGFSDDGNTITDKEVLIKAILEANKIRKPLCLHEENPYYIKHAGINRGYASEILGYRGASRKAEISMISRDIDLIYENLGTALIQHVSTKEGVELLRKLREVYSLVFAEAAPHHFTLTEEALIEKRNNAKVNPPLRTEEDRLSIIEGLIDGTIDMIATDHAPHTPACKNGPITEVPSGMIGLETALSLGIRELVNPGYLSLSRLIYKMSTMPAVFYGLPAGDIRTGKKADIVIFDPEETWKVESDGFASMSRNSPFVGETLPGVVHYTICDGNIVYSKK